MSMPLNVYPMNATNKSIKHSGSFSHCSGASHSLGVCVTQGSPCWPDQGVRGEKAGRLLRMRDNSTLGVSAVVQGPVKRRRLAGCQEVTNGHMLATGDRYTLSLLMVSTKQFESLYSGVGVALFAVVKEPRIPQHETSFRQMQPLFSYLYVSMVLLFCPSAFVWKSWW